jgi:hypothetical protein
MKRKPAGDQPDDAQGDLTKSITAATDPIERGLLHIAREVRVGFAKVAEAIRQPDEGGPADPHGNDHIHAKDFLKSGFWLPQWGPRPDEEGCQLAKPVLDWVRTELAARGDAPK